MPSTIGDTTKTTLVAKNNETVDLSFVSNVAIPLGAPVQLNADGTIEVLLKTNTEQFIGICTVPAKTAGDKATVQTKFMMIAKVKSAAAIARNAEVTSDKTNTEADGETVVVTSIAGDLVIGQALEAAAGAGEYIQIGFYPTTKVDA